MCPVCEVAAAEVEKERRRMKEEGEKGGADPVLDWLQGIREAGAPGSRSGSGSASGR